MLINGKYMFSGWSSVGDRKWMFSSFISCGKTQQMYWRQFTDVPNTAGDKAIACSCKRRRLWTFHTLPLFWRSNSEGTNCGLLDPLREILYNHIVTYHIVQSTESGSFAVALLTTSLTVPLCVFKIFYLKNALKFWMVLFTLICLFKRLAATWQPETRESQWHSATSNKRSKIAATKGGGSQIRLSKVPNIKSFMTNDILKFQFQWH